MRAAGTSPGVFIARRDLFLAFPIRPNLLGIIRIDSKCSAQDLPARIELALFSEHPIRVCQYGNAKIEFVFCESGIEIVGVWCEDTEVSGQLTDQAFEDLEQRMVDEYTTGVSDDIDERADWEYEQRKDAMLEDRD